MKNLDSIANELFNKIRGRYPSITVGDGDATITNAPKEGRFFEFDFAKGKKVSISLDEKDLTVMFSQKLFDSEDSSSKSNWYNFLKELRQFAKKRMLNFDTRDITKSNLDKRDYQYLSTEKQMSESKLYGTSRTSFQNIGSARMVIKHNQPINQEQPAGRTRDIAGIYIESQAGERFKYPVRHMNGARAMAMHVSEGGNPYDDFGKHIVGLSEELSKLRKFKTYMNRSNVMAEGLAGYMEVVNERIETVKKTAHALQSKAKYQEAFENFDKTVLEEVPEDVTNSWIDELTIKQFNEDLKDVFPYIYRLVSEANKVKDLGPEDILDENNVEEQEAEYQDEYIDVMDDDAYDFEPQADAIVNGAEFNQDAPMTEYERAFEDFKMAAANAAAKGEKEFEYPAGSGKKHPTKMDKATAAKLLADSQTNEESLSEEQLNEFVQFLVPALVAGARVVGPRLLPAAKKGAQMIGKLVGGGAKVAARNPIKTTVGGVAAANPTATMDLAKGAVDTAKTVGALPGQAKELVNKIGQNVSAAGDKVIQTADDLKAMAAGTLDNLPTMDKIAGIAKQYALPAAVVMAILYGGYKVVDSIFGKDEKEANDDDADTIDLSPKGAGDEMKQKNEIPVEEFVKSMYDYTHNAFPKGETAVLTSVQKEYGDEAVDEAGQVMQELLAGRDREMARIQQLAGVR
tara:strand:+ start:171 stop:2228 length:2058 start_codon:yes stop_codon:yes gene_type:complete